MAINAEEEETLEAIRKWWRENGNQLLTIVAAVAVSYGAWFFWDSSSRASAAAASDMYEEVLMYSIASEDERESEDAMANIANLAATLKSEYPNTVYAKYAAMFAAREAVEANDLDTAETELQWIIDNEQGGFFSQADEGLVLTATLRLGRVVLAKGDADRALALVNGVDPKTFEAGYAELRGDIYVALDRLSDANDAYQAAQQAGATSNTLQMKLDSISS